MASLHRPDSVALSGWTVTPAGGPVPPELTGPIAATVPGCIHTDLLAVGAIDDPFLDRNELDVAWVAECDWTYRTTIAAGSVPTGRDRLELVFAGLDTLAEVTIDDTVVATTENMHRSYRIDVGALLTSDRDHELTVTFRSATREAEARRAREGDWPTANFGRPFNYLRKMACSWGWDWGPWLTTAGMWQPVTLDAWDTGRLATVRPAVLVDDADRGTVTVRGDVARSGDAVELTVTATLYDPADVDVATVTLPLDPEATDFTLGIDAGTVARWWPRGHGDQPRYRLDVTLSRPDGVALDSWSKRVGFRSVELDTRPDETGAAFTFVVNGRPIFVRGVNWIPDDPFPVRVTADRYRARLDDAVAANVTMLRVWGGGIYESESFYDRCDEVGLLVWQDFAFACAAYPEHLLAAEVEAEAREQVARLTGHPSLVLWNGNNENIWGYVDWAWQPILDGRPWGAGFYFDLLPRIVAELDGTRPYWPGSPYSGTMAVAPNADAHGCVHEWEVWNRLDHARYRDRTPRFVSEFGWQAPPTWATVTAAISDSPLTPDSPGMLHHQKAADGNDKLRRGLARHFDEPGGIDAWLWATRLNQARAVQTGVEHFRSLRGRCMGTIWWQLNDCWPVTSWAVVDSGGGRKPAWHALRHAYAPRLVTVQPRGDRLVAFAVNDTGDDWSLDLTARRRGFDGTEHATAGRHVDVAAWSIGSWELPADLAAPCDPTAEALSVTGGPRVAWWCWAVDRELCYDPPSITANWSRDNSTGGLVAEITAATFVRDLYVEADRIDPALRVLDPLVTLMPGESATLTVASDSAPAGDRLATAALAPPLWWTANDLRGA